MSSPAPTWIPPPSPRSKTVVNNKVMLIAVAILFAVVIFILCLHVYAKWFWRNQASVTIVASDGTVQTLSWRRRRYRGDPRIHHPDNPAASSQSVGLARDVLEALPTFEFSGEEERKLECAVCLEDFEEGEKGRTLPKCGHDFHLECIDMWLHSHSTCPLCRTSVAGEDETKQVVVQVEEQEGEAVVGDVGGVFMAAMRASRRRQRSLSSPTRLNSLPRTGEDQEEVHSHEEMVPVNPARETTLQESLKEYETPSVSTVVAESRPTSGIRAPFQVTVDIPRAGGVGFGNSANVMSPMARASASFRRLLSRGKSAVAPQSDEDGPSSSPRTPSPPPPPTPPPPPNV